MKKPLSRLGTILVLFGFALFLAACVRPTPGSEDQPTPAPLPTTAPIQPTVAPVEPTSVPEEIIPTEEAIEPTAPAPEPTAVPPESGGQPGESTVHVVAPGDTLYNISLRYGVSMDAIMVANNMSNPNNLVVGEQLVIPADDTGGQPPSGEVVHIVKPGENLFRIGLQYGCTVDQLVQYNGLPSADTIIYVGDQIRIPAEC